MKNLYNEETRCMNNFEGFYNIEIHEYNQNQIGEKGSVGGHIVGKDAAKIKEGNEDGLHNFNGFDDNIVDQFGNIFEFGSSCGDSRSSFGN